VCVRVCGVYMHPPSKAVADWRLLCEFACVCTAGLPSKAVADWRLRGGQELFTFALLRRIYSSKV
jgi:hypothetical protein